MRPASTSRSSTQLRPRRPSSTGSRRATDLLSHQPMPAIVRASCFGVTMTQEAVQITTTPPLPGLQLVQDLNKALQTLATDFSGATDPAAMAWPYSTWADTSTGTMKRRNSANSAWAIEGRLLRAHLPMYAQADVPALDIGPIYIIGKGPAEWVTSQYKVLTSDFPSNDDLQWL